MTALSLYWNKLKRFHFKHYRGGVRHIPVHKSCVSNYYVWLCKDPIVDTRNSFTGFYLDEYKLYRQVKHGPLFPGIIFFNFLSVKLMWLCVRKQSSWQCMCVCSRASKLQQQLFPVTPLRAMSLKQTPMHCQHFTSRFPPAQAGVEPGISRMCCRRCLWKYWPGSCGFTQLHHLRAQGTRSCH